MLAADILMPYKSVKQQRFMESSASPLSEKQKKEWRAATNFKTLPERVGINKLKKPPGR